MQSPQDDQCLCNTGMPGPCSDPPRLTPQLCQACGLHDFDPVAVGVFDRARVLHLALIRAFHKRDPVVIKPLHRGIRSGGEKQMWPKPCGWALPSLVFEVGIVLCSPVVGELQNATLVEGPGSTFTDILGRAAIFLRTV